MKTIAKVIKWIFEKLKKKNQPQFTVEISFKIINIHKD